MNPERPDFPAAPRALVYHSGAVGDFITTLPAIKLWRDWNPGAPLTLLGNPAIGAFAVKAGYAEEAWDLNRACFAGLYNGTLAAQLKRRLESFKTVIVFANPESAALASMRALQPPQLFHQPPFPTARQHVVDYHLALFKSHYPLPQRTRPEVVVRSDTGTEPSTQPPIVIHHGSGSPRKNWPIDRFRELGQWLNDLGENVCWLQGPADGSPPAQNGDVVINGDDLWQFASVLVRARLYVGNDSGLSHLAAAVGCPSVVLFGASDPDVWRPLGPHVVVIRAESGCLTCHPDGVATERCAQMCMAAIPVARVMAECSGLWGR